MRQRLRFVSLHQSAPGQPQLRHLFQPILELMVLRYLIQTIPYNLYAILTLVMLLTITVLRVDFGPMKHHEMNAIAGDLFTTPGRPYEDNEEEIIKENSHVLDLVLPVVVLIASWYCSPTIYTGGFFTGASFLDAFANSSASVGLVLGGSVILAFTFFLFIICCVMYFLSVSLQSVFQMDLSP